MVEGISKKYSSEADVLGQEKPELVKVHIVLNT